MTRFASRVRLTLLILLCAAASAVAQKASAPPAHPLFDTDNVHEIWLTFQQPDWFQQLTNNFRDNEDDVPYIEASFVWNEYSFEKVGVRFKGNSSYRGATTDKKPFRIKLNEYTKGQKIQGIASLNLNNGWNDPSMVREKIHFDVAAKAGMTAPRMNYAALYVNGKYWGLYFLGEIVNDDFLDSRYASGNRSGNLYKSELPGTLMYLGTDKEAYRREFEKKSNEDVDDWSDLIALTEALNEPDATLAEKLEPLLDVDSALRALALDNFLVNMDSYAGMGQNYYLYRRPADGKFEFIIWDPSLSFGAFGVNGVDPRQVPLEYLHANRGPGGGGPGVPPGGGVPPAANTSRPLATKLWANAKYKARYYEIYRDLAEKIVDANEIVARSYALQSMIRGWFNNDTQKLTTMAAFETAITQAIQTVTPGVPPVVPGGPGGGPGGFGGAPGIETLMRGRVDFVKTQLPK